MRSVSLRLAEHWAENLILGVVDTNGIAASRWKAVVAASLGRMSLSSC